MESAVASCNEFGLKILHVHRDDNPQGNVFYSPVSIAICLRVLHTGAKEDTKKEIEEVLSFDDSHVTHEGFRALLKSLQDLSNHITLNIANVLAVDRKYKILPEFLDNIKANYINTEIKQLPIQSHPEESRKELNRSIEEATNGKIREPFVPGVISQDTKLVLGNAIYFKGEWRKQFEKNNTKKTPFYTINKEKVMVDMMCIRYFYKYIRSNDLSAEILQKPYLGGKISLVILLPFERYGLPLVENNISVEGLNRAIQEMHPQKAIILSLPKFKLEENFPLKQCLLDMGMVAPFTSDADFSGISGNRDLLVSSALHEAFIDINEEGTEAAAATCVLSHRNSFPPDPIYFTVNHPFMIFIRESSSGLILFTGSIQTI